MEKREEWRAGIKLTDQEVEAVERARACAQQAKDFEYDRRLRGLLLVGRERFTQASAAQMLEVSASAITYWVMDYRRGGVEALQTGKAPGARPRLGEQERSELTQLVVSGPEACGFDTGVWDSKLVKKLIKQRFDVDLSASQVRRVLRSLGFSVQYPKRVFARADKAAQKTWMMETYPEIKKKRKRSVES